MNVVTCSLYHSIQTGQYTYIPIQDIIKIISERNNFWQYIALVQDKQIALKMPTKELLMHNYQVKKIRNTSPAIKSS